MSANLKNKVLLGFAVTTGKPVYISVETFKRHLIYLGKSGSGKSYAARQHFLSVAGQNGWNCGLIDPNSHLARDILDEVVMRPSLKRRCLYLAITNRNFVPLLDFMQQSTSETRTDRARRIYLATFFATALIMTAGHGGSTAGAAFVRLKMSVEMGCRLLMELGLPLAILPHLFRFRSKILPVLLQRTEDPDVRDHFANLIGIKSPHQHYTLVESTVTRLNLFFGSAITEAMFSVAGSGLTIDQLVNRDRMILVCDFGVTEESTVEHSRLLQKILLESLTRAVMKRTEEEALAKPFMLFIDEASSSGLLDLANAEALQVTRKFGLHTAYIIQGVAGANNRQPEVQLLDSVFENTAGKLIYGVASDVDAQRLARLSIGGLDFTEVKYRKEFERQRLVGYESTTRTTVSMDHEGRRSISTTPMDRPILETEQDEQIYFYTAEELFHRKAGELLSLPVGRFLYFGPEYPEGILLFTPAPKRMSNVTKRMRARRREAFVTEQLAKFPYRDVDGVRREFVELLHRYGLPQEEAADEAGEQISPFE